MNPLSVEVSRVSITQYVMPFMANYAGLMHGGELVKMMDNTASVSACRYSGTYNVTAQIFDVSFNSPITLGEIIILEAHVVYTGRTSIAVQVKAKAEDLLKRKIRDVSKGSFLMIAVDQDGKPAAVPPLLIENEQQKLLADSIQKRIEENKAAKL